jgi:AcrR family transcriptional regulator
VVVARVQTPRTAWIDAALDALTAGGPDAVRIEALAASLGVSKGGFYWHFANRQALITEMLDAWEQAGTEQVIERIDSEPGDARAKLRRLFVLAPSANFAVELALRDWSRRDAGVARRLRRIDNRRMAFLRTLFEQFCPDQTDAEARTMLAYSLMIGSYFIAAKDGQRSRSQMLGLAVERLLGGGSWG